VPVKRNYWRVVSMTESARSRLLHLLTLVLDISETVLSSTATWLITAFGPCYGPTVLLFEWPLLHECTFEARGKLAVNKFQSRLCFQRRRFCVIYNLPQLSLCQILPDLQNIWQEDALVNGRHKTNLLVCLLSGIMVNRTLVTYSRNRKLRRLANIKGRL